MIFAFAVGNPSAFIKPIATLGLIAVVFVIFCAAFDVFPTAYHLLPATSDAYLNVQLRDFKDWLWSTKVTNTIILAASALIVGFFITRK